MSPLRVSQNDIQLAEIKNNGLPLSDGTVVTWDENTGRACVENSQSVKPTIELFLSRVGDSGGWDITVMVPPIEAGEAPTPVRRRIKVERT